MHQWLVRYLISWIVDSIYPRIRFLCSPFQAQPTDECLFKEKLGTNYFNTYASYKYSGRNPGNITQEFYIAIKKNGKLKHGANTAMIQKSVDFTVVALKKGRSHG